MGELALIVWPWIACAACLGAVFQPWLLRRLALQRQRDKALLAMGRRLPPLRRAWPLASALLVLIHGGLLAGAVMIGAATPLPALIGLAALTIMLGLVDWRALWLPDALVVPLGAIGFGVSIAGGAPWFWPLIGAGGGYLIFLGLRLGYRALRGVEGLGGGDVRLAAAMGAWTGPETLSLAVLLACLLALAAAPFLFGREGSRASRLPLGTFLAVGLFAAMSVGPALL